MREAEPTDRFIIAVPSMGMARSLEDTETTTGCVLVGTSEWIRTATATLADEAVSVAGAVVTS